MTDEELELKAVKHVTLELQTEQRRVKKVLFGNGSPGLDERIAIMERTVFANPKTGEPGLVAEMRETRRVIAEFTTTVRVLMWLVGFLGLTGAIEVLRLLGVGV